MVPEKRILFVDDEPNILSGLRRMLRSKRREWDMDFVSSGAEALTLLSRKPVDVVVTDMRMPGMDGAQLLKEVMERSPETVRIVLSGQADREAILQAVGPIHQYLSKPCDAETLKATLTRACMLDERLSDPELKRLISRIETLPSLPSLYHEVVGELQSPDASPHELGQMISRDMGMSAKILQLVSSAFFGLRAHVPHPTQAVILLGLDTVKILGLSVRAFSQFDHTQPAGFSLNSFWDHSVTVGKMAQRLAQSQGADQKLIDYAYIAGLLHDLGKLVLAVHFPEKYATVLKLAAAENIEVSDAERLVFETATHAEIGAYLLDLWGLPDPIVEAVAWHHHPERQSTPGFDSVIAVHVANVCDHALSQTGPSDCDPHFNRAYLSELSLIERLPAWQEICRQAAHEENS